MKIIHISDIHGDFETFATVTQFVKDSDADILAITGDLSGSVFNEPQKEAYLKAHSLLSRILPGLYRDTRGQIDTLEKTALLLLEESTRADAEVKDKANVYKTSSYAGREKMLSNYRLFKRIFDEIGKRVILIPGNWDGKCLEDVLNTKSIHNNSKEDFNGISFIGYGGSNRIPVEIPAELTIDFDEAEAYKHLVSHEKAEVALTHVAPAGFAKGDSFAVLAYLNLRAPSLLLCGDTHKPSIMEYSETGTIISNPGNLGRYQDEDFGTFFEIDIDGESFVSPRYAYKVTSQGIKKTELG